MNTPHTPLYEKTGVEPAGYGGYTAPVPEKLNLWDRIFNRYRREVHDRGSDRHNKTVSDILGNRIPSLDSFTIHNWVEYRVIDRLTGSVRIEREYLT